MGTDHVIHSLKFDLTHLSKQKHQLIEDRIVRIFNQSFYSIIHKVASRFAAKHDVVVSQLVLDLGGIPQEELEQQVPLRFEKALQDYFSKREKAISRKDDTKEEKLKHHPLVFYLFYGIYPWYAPQKGSFANNWSKSIVDQKFIQHLFQIQWPQRAIKRLVQIGFLDLLKQTLKALVPEQSAFILNYHHELLVQHKRGELAKTESKRSYHGIIWEFTFQFILNAKGSRFSKKQFIIYQIKSLSGHYNIRINDFIQLLLKGFQALKTQHHHRKELYSILVELNEDFQKRGEEQEESQLTTEERKIATALTIDEVEKMLQSSSLNQVVVLQLKQWLLKRANIERVKQSWLNPLKEKLLYATVEIIVGTEGKNIIQGYHELLWQQNETVVAETPIATYKQAIWRFTLDFFYQSFSSYFQAKEFVRYHSRKVAQHFNLNPIVFLGSLISAVRELHIVGNQLDLLSKVLLSIHKEEPVADEERKMLNQQHTDQLLVQMIKTFESTVFHSEKELYFFLENWAIRLIEETGREEVLPISFLLKLFKTRKKVSKSFLNTLLRHQQYELLYDKRKIIDEELINLSETGIRNFEQELSLHHFVLGKKPLSLTLLLKLLFHEKQLSFAVVEKLRADFKKEHFQLQLIKEWVPKFNSRQYAQLIRLLFGSDQYLLAIFELIQFSLKEQKINVKGLFLIGLFESGGEEERKLWKRQLELFSKELAIGQVELETKIAHFNFELSTHQIHYLSYYFYLRNNKRFFGSQSTNWLKEKTKEFDLKIFQKMEAVDAMTFSDAEKKNWNDYLLNQLLTEPSYLMKLYFGNQQFKFAWQKNKAWLSVAVRQLFRTRYSQWGRIKTLLTEATINSGTADRLIQFILHFEEPGRDFKVTFSAWKQEEIYLLRQYLKERVSLEKWVHLKASIKIDFLKRSKIIGTDFFLTYYIQLEEVYRQLPTNQRPYSYFEFEVTFWKFLNTIWNQQWSIWQIFEKWVTFMTLALRVKATEYGNLEQLIPEKHEKQWDQLKEKNENKVSLEKIKEEASLADGNQEEEIPEIAIDKVEFDHVGLVILHPFLKQLMMAMKLLDEQNKFKSETTKERAVCMLHYLATGEKYGVDSLEEHELAFPKLICGMPISRVVNSNLKLKSDEIEMADGMLIACLQHWDKLRGSSADALRNTFLKRRGTVQEKDSAYQLYVEGSGTDVLLDYLPWSISLIRLPWLEQAIYVSWR